MSTILDVIAEAKRQNYFCENVSVTKFVEPYQIADDDINVDIYRDHPELRDSQVSADDEAFDIPTPSLNQLVQALDAGSISLKPLNALVFFLGEVCDFKHDSPLRLHYMFEVDLPSRSVAYNRAFTQGDDKGYDTLAKIFSQQGWKVIEQNHTDF